MKLADWMHFRRGITSAELQVVLGIGRSMLRKILAGERRPGLELSLRIIRFTDGEVRLDDLLSLDPPDCCVVITLPNGKTRRVLPWTNRDDWLDLAVAAVRKEPRAEDGPSPPVKQAMEVLQSRVTLLPRSRFLLDGRPTDPRRLIREANRILIALGRPPIRYPGLESE